MRLSLLIALSLLGFIFARLFHIHDLQQTDWYLFVVSSLLASGLYASTYGISLKEAREHLRLVVSAVTVGVVAKALLIGVSLTFVFGDPFFLVLGVIVAQIDPLSVAGLMKGVRLSKKAKTIIACWASFDDPVTVILALYAPLIVAHITGTHTLTLPIMNNPSSGLINYAKTLAANVLFVGIVFGLWKLAHNYRQRKSAAVNAPFRGFSTYLLLAISLVISTMYLLMLGIAIIGLFLRPAKVGLVLDRIIIWIFRAAIFLIGFVLVNGVALWRGVALGVAAYCSQIIVGWVLTHDLGLRDRIHISCAQQNGITAIVLALLFEPAHPGTVAVVAPAIIVINSLHAITNHGVDRYLNRTH